jgi:hypothetical protein
LKTPSSFIRPNQPAFLVTQNPPELVLIVRAFMGTRLAARPRTLMAFIFALLLSCSPSAVSAQTPPAPGPAATQSAPGSKPAVKKSAPKAKSGAKAPAAAESGPCQIGVIAAIGTHFTVQTIGLTVFGNEEAQVPVEGWGLEDLAVARVRTALPGVNVRRIAYASGAFDPYYDPAPKLFRKPAAELPAIVRQVAANSGCGRYVVITRFAGTFPGTNQTMQGVGILKRGIGDLIGHNYLFANVQVTVFDGQTFEIQKNPSLSVGTLLAAAFLDERGPALTEIPFPAPAAEAANSAALRDGARALLAKRLDKTLAGYFKP